jgi:ribosome-binding protein aMBF1 (putative translation factor)
MKTNRIAMLSVLALAATAQIAQAQTHRVQAQVPYPVQAQMTHSEHPDLLAAQQTLAWRSLNSKGVQRDALASEERKIDSLIDDLERGRAVDPHEIDRVLERANRGSF